MDRKGGQLHGTFFSYGRSKENLPNRTWKGEQARVPIEPLGAIHPDDTDRRTIFLLYDNHVDGPAQGGWIDGIPGLGDRATDAPDVLHPAIPGPKALPRERSIQGRVRRVEGSKDRTADGNGRRWGSRLYAPHVTATVGGQAAEVS